MPTADLVSLAVVHLLDAMAEPFPSEHQLSFSRALSRELRRRTDGMAPHAERCVCQVCTEDFWEGLLEVRTLLDDL